VTRPAVTAIALEFGVDAYELLEDWEERAAIREYQGGQSRQEAERQAVGDVRAMAEARAAKTLAGTQNRRAR
jgi:hypothetical protein